MFINELVRASSNESSTAGAQRVVLCLSLHSSNKTISTRSNMPTGYLILIEQKLAQKYIYVKHVPARQNVDKTGAADLAKHGERASPSTFGCHGYTSAFSSRFTNYLQKINGRSILGASELLLESYGSVNCESRNWWRQSQCGAVFIWNIAVQDNIDNNSVVALARLT